MLASGLNYLLHHLNLTGAECHECCQAVQWCLDTRSGSRWPNTKIPLWHWATYTVLLSHSGRHGTVEDFTFKGLVFSRRILVLYIVTQPTRRNTKGAQHTRSFPGRPWHSDSHIPLPHRGCVHTSRVGADYINLQALSGWVMSLFTANGSVLKVSGGLWTESTGTETLKRKRRPMLSFDNQGFAVLGGLGETKQSEARPQSGPMTIIRYLLISSYRSEHREG